MKKTASDAGQPQAAWRRRPWNRERPGAVMSVPQQCGYAVDEGARKTQRPLSYAILDEAQEDSRENCMTRASVSSAGWQIRSTHRHDRFGDRREHDLSDLRISRDGTGWWEARCSVPEAFFRARIARHRAGGARWRSAAEPQENRRAAHTFEAQQRKQAISRRRSLPTPGH